MKIRRVVSVTTGYGMSQRVKYHALNGTKTLCGLTPNLKANWNKESSGINWKSPSAFVCQRCAKKIGAR